MTQDINIEKLEEAIDQIDDGKKTLAKCLVTELKFLMDTLAALKEAIALLGVVDNSTEQIKESPALKTYNQTIKSYSTCIKQLNTLLRESKGKDATDDLQAFLEAEK